MRRTQSKPSLSATLRAAIRDSGKSAYRINQDTGIPITSVLRFLTGETSLRLETADLLAEYLGLELQPKLKTKLKRKGG